MHHSSQNNEKHRLSRPCCHALLVGFSLSLLPTEKPRTDERRGFCTLVPTARIPSPLVAPRQLHPSLLSIHHPHSSFSPFIFISSPLLYLVSRIYICSHPLSIFTNIIYMARFFQISFSPVLSSLFFVHSYAHPYVCISVAPNRICNEEPDTAIYSQH